jgi:hypothetical protein
LGPDPDIRVYRRESTRTREAGGLSSWDRTEYTVDIRLSNIGSESKTMTIRERIPVSELERIRVKFDAEATAKGCGEPDADGMLEWPLSLGASDRTSLKLLYTMETHKKLSACSSILHRARPMKWYPDNMMIKFAIGSYTNHQSPNIDARGRGITIVAWDVMTGDYRLLDEFGDITNPTFLDWRPEIRRLYAVCAAGDGRGALSSFSVAPDGTMDFLGRRENPGRSGCHLTALPDNGRIFAVSYSDGRLTGYGLDDGMSDR